jgi:hypothetical protein
MSTTQKILNSLMVVVCFGFLAWLNGRYAASGAGQVVLYTVIGLALTLLGFLGLAGLNLAADPLVLRPWGFAAVWVTVMRGFLAVIPFTLLALLAELAYHWRAAPAFIQASLMACGAAAGAELMRRAGPKARYLLVSMIVAFVLAALWTVFSYLFQRVAAG